VAVRFFTAAELAAESPRLKNPSDVVAKEVGTPGVAEAAALAAAGTRSELIVEKTKSARATCAIARAPAPILDLRGKPRGILHVVGVGPGARDWRAPAAATALEAASDWVGYGLYLDLVADLKTDQTEHRFPLGGEVDRVRHAIALATEGKQVALICSGDAGIYAMAALAYEIIDHEPNRIAVDVIPGISAFQAAAAKAGAMIGHDFCCISLSDLLTPWEVIERRVKAAAEGDFVVSFYNPRSLKRRDQLQRAFAIMRDYRPSETPVVIASNLGRPEEKVTIVPFSAFNPDDVDMLTLVMVGASQSKSFTRGDGKAYAYTPRGYAKKREAK
jgi:cobalt-precorrin 5A hydrolase/precorrin-3B C17-methyltransferase